MDVTLDQIILLVAAVGGLGAVAQHFWDRYAPSGLYKAAPARAAEALRGVFHTELQGLPMALEVSMSNAMDRQRALAAEEVKAEMAAAQKAMEDAGKGQEQSLKMSAIRAIGTDKAQMQELNQMAVEGILGPVLPALEAWNPDWADRLRRMDPNLLIRFIDSPLFQQQILPRIQPYIQRFMGGSSSSSEPVNTGWGT